MDKKTQYLALGNQHYQAKQYKQSIMLYANALELDSTLLIAYINISKIQEASGKQYEALITLQKALKYCKSPDLRHIYCPLANLHKQLGNNDQAMLYAKRALLVHTGTSVVHQCHVILGDCLSTQSQYKQALVHYHLAIALNSDIDFNYGRLASAYFNCGDFENGMQVYKRGLLVASDYRHYIASNMGTHYLEMGNYAKGWEFAESRVYKPNFAQYMSLAQSSKTIWRGQNIEDKTIGVFYEQGYGDNIMFFRYLLLLHALKPRKIIFVITSNLVELFKASLPQCEYVSISDPISCHYQCMLMSLPYIFATRSYDIPKQSPYLRAPKHLTTRLALNKAKTNIAIVWQINKNAKRIGREIDIEYFAPLATLENVALISLQVGEYAQEAKTCTFANKIIDATPYIHSFADTAKILEDIDLVVCVDTAIAHLCGALNKPFYIVLKRHNDWRWGSHEKHSDWYDSARLYRENNFDDFGHLFEQIKSDIVNKVGFHPKQTVFQRAYLPTNLRATYDKLFQKARHYYKQERYELSKNLLIRVLLKYNSEEVWYLLALIQMQINSKSWQVIEYFQKAISFRERFESHFFLGYLYTQPTKYCHLKKSCFHFEKALALKPSDQKTIQSLLYLYKKLDQPDKITQLQKA